MMNNTSYIYAGWMIDGSGGPIREKVLLTVVRGLVVDIDRFDSNNAPDSALITDLSYGTILPPFIDSHVHLALSATVDQRARERQLAAGYGDIQSIISQNLHYLFSHGVLAVRDGGDRQGHVLRYKNGIHGSKTPVILKAAGQGWHQRGRYGSMLGRYPQEGDSLVAACAREIEHVDHVKLINSGPNSLRSYGRQTPPQFELEELREVVSLAAKHGKRVMVHANGRLPVRMALEAGCHSIEHGYFMGRDNLELMAEKQTVWVPTLYAMKACAENMVRQEEKEVAQKTLHHQLGQVSLARELGVTVALGTDAGSPGVIPGESVVEEIKLFKKAGFSLPEAVQCATSNGASLLGINEMGRIAKGRPATFLVTRGTPAQLPRKFSYLEAIYTDGMPNQFYLKNPVKRGVAG